MSQGKLFLTSLGMALVALFLQFVGLSLESRATLLRAQVVQKLAVRGSASLTPEEQGNLKVQTDAYRHRAAIVRLCGAATAIASIGFVACSARRREPAWRSVTFAVLFIYAMSFFVLV